MRSSGELQTFVNMMNHRWPFGDSFGPPDRSISNGSSHRQGRGYGLGSLNDLSSNASKAAATATITHTISRTKAPFASSQSQSSGFKSTSSSSLSLPSTTTATTTSSSTSPPSSSDVMGQITEISDGLYLCGARAIKVARLRELGITTILNVTIELPSLQIDKIEHIKIAIDDSPYANLGCYFDKVSDKIEEVRKQGGKILVHCVAGVSRSASLCIAYLMKHSRMNLRRAYHHVKSRRSIIRPNPGFFRQLVQYESSLFGSSSVKMIWSAAAGTSIPDLYESDYGNTASFLKNYGSRMNDHQHQHQVSCKHAPSSSMSMSMSMSTPTPPSNKCKAHTQNNNKQRGRHSCTWSPTAPAAAGSNNSLGSRFH